MVVALGLFALVTKRWATTILMKPANLLRLDMVRTFQRARLLLHTGLTNCFGLVMGAQQNLLPNLKNTLWVSSGALSGFLFISPALAYNEAEEADKTLVEYIRILDLELASRHSTNTIPLPRAKPPVLRIIPVPRIIPIPRSRPAHPLTTYRNLYVYVVHPWDFDRQRTIKCYSVGIDKYGYIVKIPCKEKE
jgi:hypothetical protein